MKTEKKLSFKDKLIEEYKKTIAELVKKLSKKDKEIEKYREKLKK